MVLGQRASPPTHFHGVPHPHRSSRPRPPTHSATTGPVWGSQRGCRGWGGGGGPRLLHTLPSGSPQTAGGAGYRKQRFQDGALGAPRQAQVRWEPGARAVEDPGSCAVESHLCGVECRPPRKWSWTLETWLCFPALCTQSPSLVLDLHFSTALSVQ